jgi:hypothetical protein
MRSGGNCECDDGWTGINCNVCTEDKVCNALMETGEDGVCYQGGELINHNYQICDVTNDKITTLLGKQRPEVTFTCKAEDKSCDFQCKMECTLRSGCYLLADIAQSGSMPSNPSTAICPTATRAPTLVTRRTRPHTSAAISAAAVYRNACFAGRMAPSTSATS